MTPVQEEVKFHLDSGYRIRGSLTYGFDTIEEMKLIEVRFNYNKTMLEEIKNFDGARWNKEKRCWTIKDNSRNRFQLEYLKGGNPYARYDQELLPYESKRPLRKHQILMVQAGITYRDIILGAEMGTGKSLVAISIAEYSGYASEDIIYVGPKSALRSVQLEFMKWKSPIWPKFVTYDGLKKLVETWPSGKPAPKMLIGDESSRIKTPTAQRSQAFHYLSEMIRQEHPHDHFIIEMTGTPAPKSPADWWHQCECACPGFLKEGTLEKFKRRLGIIVDKEGIGGGVFPYLVTWRDDSRKCDVCGQMKDHMNHDTISMVTETVGVYHVYKPSINEVETLYERMKGLVHIVFKRDCLDLPEKQYEILECEPSPSIVRSAQLVAARATSAASAMILLRELSDGFQYQEEETGTKTCPYCKGAKEVEMPVATDRDSEEDEEVLKTSVQEGDYQLEIVTCPTCGGEGQVPAYTREVVRVPTPKDDRVKELLDQYDDIGRTVFWGAFAGTIDRIIELCEQMKWEWIKVDGRGWKASWGRVKELDMLRVFQKETPDWEEEHPRVAFIGQPGAGGMGLTLTASPMACYVSNDFNAESRAQSEDRVHRMGMDMNRGCIIYDIIHLPTDRLVLENLRNKIRLQAMSMGAVVEAMKHIGEPRKV